MEWLIAVWAIAMVVIAFNLCAAGVAAILHAWRSKIRRPARVAAAAATTGVLPASTLIVVGLVEVGWPTSSVEDPFVAALAFALVMGLTMLASLPGAFIVARKLEAPGDDFRAFE
jgi:hypothetical protein